MSLPCTSGALMPLPCTVGVLIPLPCTGGTLMPLPCTGGVLIPLPCTGGTYVSDIVADAFFLLLQKFPPRLQEQQPPVQSSVRRTQCPVPCALHCTGIILVIIH